MKKKKKKQEGEKRKAGPAGTIFIKKIDIDQTKVSIDSFQRY